MENTSVRPCAARLDIHASDRSNAACVHGCHVRNAYENLKKTFNPVGFDPDKWAAAAEYAGMKYVVFTSKHHDGFCMFDTHQTDYKITSEECPFHADPRANITKQVLDAYRAHGIKAGVYFSFPDWHNNDFWWRRFPPKGKHINYDPANLVMVGTDDEVQGVFDGGDAIVHTHAKDGICVKKLSSGEEFYHGFAVGGLEWTRLGEVCRETPLGEGSVRWTEYLNALKAIGYDGYLTIEREVKNGAEDIRMAVRFLQEMIAKID